MDKKYTIKDIAALAGVSKGTVDRVLHKRGKVSETALVKVNKVLDEIDYQPNPMAKNLRINKIFKLFVLIPNVGKDSFWLPCKGAIQEFEDAYKGFGIKVENYFFDPASTASFLETAREMISHEPDAILTVPIFAKEAHIIVKECYEAGIKVSIFNNFIASEYVHNFIGQDLYQSGRVAANLLHMLLKKGHIGIIHIDEESRNATHLQEKEKGFRNYFAGLESEDYQISTLSISHKDPVKFKSTLLKFLDQNENLEAMFVTISKSHLVADAIKDRVQKQLIVGYDLVDKNVHHLKNGGVNFLINQKPKEQVTLALNYLAEYFLFDKPIPVEVLLPIVIVNAESVDGYLV
ncbi:MAG: LacI family transcriptional regulator [Flavobacteriaceae bacterium]|nr:MAG: LacI family transcriptional regulator [Flavobacteriaceae bacterium]